jgi:hypothetical protein
MEWTAGALYEGRSTLIDRYGLTTQIWLAKPCFDNRLALGAGISPKIAVVNKGGRQGRSAPGHSPEHLKSEDA